jgi:hypothetical protein
MDVAEQLAPNKAEQQLSWAQICDRYPNEWVFLLDIEKTADGSIGAGYVIGHDRSMKQLLSQIPSQPNTVIVHTSGRPLRFPSEFVVVPIRFEPSALSRCARSSGVP